MKILIDDEIYEGAGAEILNRLRLQFDDRNEYPDTESYIRQLQSNLIRSTGKDCVLPESGLERRAQALIRRLADINALEILEET